ncbi:hypothetical protein C8N46_105319 [Kordia periserrulae]|uniref:Uncharacterized protein n=1 Tax=Kordia periserrulae TaxID=701523 RepID=A0A2T6BYM5_9FLAO|nr:hypothetical protein [Kordia periserrulae]PTX61162.1 hypothetical protein C8N46_105319 [Kordia periserrulae]
MKKKEINSFNLKKETISTIAKLKGGTDSKPLSICHCPSYGHCPTKQEEQ